MAILVRHDKAIELHEDASLEVRCGDHVFRFGGNGCALGGVAETGATIAYSLLVPGWRMPVKAELGWAADGNPTLSLTAEGEMPEPLEYPGALESQSGDMAYLPAGEGLAIPVEDQTIPLFRERFQLNSQAWHMAMTALSRGGEAWMVQAVDVGVNVSVRALRPQGLLTFQVCWEPQLGQWGYGRTMRFLVGERGGLNALCKAYRAYRDELGQTATLREKRRKLPQLDKLIGAADVWIWADDYENFMYGQEADAPFTPVGDELMRIADELKSGGCEKAIMGVFFAESCKAARTMAERTGFLVAKYDNLEDQLPAPLEPLIPAARIKECDYTERRMKSWPRDTRMDREGYSMAWALRGKDGQMHSQNHVCPYFAEQIASREVPDLARKFGFNAWFFDVMGGGTAECWSENHPLTARDCVRHRRQAFQVLTEAGLIPGTEEGVECYLDAFCYNEGKMSPALYRNNYLESGRRKAHAYTPDEHDSWFDRFMLNPIYRVPLWDLVYHDCCVSYWYWGDSSNCCPELMDRRDLFNALYGQPPLYSMHVTDWNRRKEDVLRSQKRATQVATLTGYAKLISFDYCTENRLVQRTVFDNGIAVTVNFSKQDWQTADGRTIPALDYRIDGDAP